MKSHKMHFLYIVQWQSLCKVFPGKWINAHQRHGSQNSHRHTHNCYRKSGCPHLKISIFRYGSRFPASKYSANLSSNTHHFLPHNPILTYSVQSLKCHFPIHFHIHLISTCLRHHKCRIIIRPFKKRRLLLLIHLHAAGLQCIHDIFHVAAA